MPSPLPPLGRRPTARGLIAAGLLAAGLLAASAVPRLQAASAKDLPDPAVAETPAGSPVATATAVLAGGCF